MRTNLWIPRLLRQIAFALLVCRVDGAYAGQEDPKPVVIFHDPSQPQAVFAAGEIREALRESGLSVSEKSLDALPADNAPVRVVLAEADSETVRSRFNQAGEAPIASLSEQGYAIRKTASDAGTVFWAIGADPAGVMYGGLHLAECIRVDSGFDGITDTAREPYVLRRGIKFNIPLDVRTPSYDDTGDAAQTNYVHMWDFAFWRKFLDAMARHRYNTLTLWNPHPFPSLVKCPNYPDVALDDVCVTTLKPTYESRAWREPMFVYPEVFENLKVVKRMTIDEKINFWRRVMQHARDRGIDVYFITWNVIVNAAEGKHGITAEQDNPKTIAYLRECVRELILTYPLLAGIGVTAGENMKSRDDEFAKEKWLWKTYGLGVLDAKERQPDRRVRFIHRVWQTGVDEVMREFGSKYPDTFELGFKYARAHMYSSTKPPFADQLCEETKPHGVRCWWNLRNDDIFNFRWGDPDYAREFLLSLPPKDLTAGYHMGSDGYVWGVTFTSLGPERPRQLEIEKHWYRFMLWGRLGYDPSLDRQFFEKVLAWRFPEAPSDELYDAWQAASKIIPLVNRFHWRNWDFMWAVEGCMDQRKGFHTVDDFINTPPMEGSGMVSTADYVDAMLAGKQVEGTTPIDVAENLDSYARQALRMAAAVGRGGPALREELQSTLADIEAMAHLGDYYSAKIRGAVELCAFRKSKDAARQGAAVRHLLEAEKHWRNYAEAAASQYRPQLLARTRRLDWMRALDDVRRDVDIARTAAAE